MNGRPRHLFIVVCTLSVGLVLVGCPRESMVQRGGVLFEIMEPDAKRLGPDQVQLDVSFLEITQKDALEVGFFGEGSDPFFGRINLKGEPLGTSQFVQGNIGNSAAVLKILEDAPLQSVGSQAQVIASLSELSLVSIDPIVVPFNNNQSTQEWGVRLTVTPTVANTGFMQLQRDSNDGGTLSASLPIAGEVIFNRIDTSDTRILELPSQNLILEQTGFSWLIGDLNWPEQDASNAVPALARIPSLGRLFRREHATLRSTELMIIVIPTIVDILQ